MGKKGIALVAIIIIILFVAVAVSGATVFISNRLKGADTWQRILRCRYNAQAGLHYALYQYRSTTPNTSFSGTVNIDANNTATVTTSGSAASSLTVDATNSSLTSSSRNLQEVTLTNTSAATITIDRMIVTWTGTSRTLQDIRINNNNVWNTNVSSSPANVDITNTSIASGVTANLTRVRWNSSMETRTITLQFVMTDGTTTSVCTAYPTPGSTCTTPASILTIQSTGRTTGSTMYKTVQATYTTATGNISDYDEIATAVP